MRKWQLGIPLVGFAAILTVAFLAPRDTGFHCPWFAVECGSGLVLFIKPVSSFLRFYLPAGIGGAALVLLTALVRPERVRRGMFLIVAAVVLAGTLAAVFLLSGTVSDPLRCSVIPPGGPLAGLIACGVRGAHTDARLALRYLVLVGGLISAGVVLIESMIRRQAPRDLSGGVPTLA